MGTLFKFPWCWWMAEKLIECEIFTENSFQGLHKRNFKFNRRYTSFTSVMILPSVEEMT
ncbi:hypothetical protein Glove_168g130 [Diversispora epigaea]|uniref:Uncharacterized protein n=1 Tax=Diversispora epigaea TaxID=1348612 RepID=A0A397IQ10_9GLOM|nr:hypothetical protein Glove_168g129 [Diversispora epigaea]RHZ78035.1 hypothetical protein Glove_168g130 [Diversispora epigaea]